MLTIKGNNTQQGSDISRRNLLHVGGLGACGLTLPGLWGAQKIQAAEPGNSNSPTFGRAKHCILLYMWGGPPHQDTFDPKPDAPAEARGEFGAISTNVPGIMVTDHLPRMAQQADKYTILRSMTHKNGDHIGVSHDSLTGNVYPYVNPVVTAARNDHPHYGAVLAHLKPRDNGLPGYVQLPCNLRSNSGKVIPGQNGGFLGQKYDPFTVDAVPNKGVIQDPEFKSFSPSAITLPREVSNKRLDGRRRLLELVEQQLRRVDQTAEQRGFGSLYQQAFSMLASPNIRKAFDLAGADPAQRDRYGRHTFGQGVLMARRLVEAGVPLVTAYWPNGPVRTDIGWDNHVNNFRNLKNWQLPPVDRAVSALLEDLADTGQLDDTLVVWMGEFGRTPSVNNRGGRDHWPHVYSVLLAGAGIRGGQVYGASDKQAAAPISSPVSPSDLGATIFHYLGIDVKTELTDLYTDRPYFVCRGTPIPGLI